MGRNYINIALFQQYNTAKKLTEGGYPNVLHNKRLADYILVLITDCKHRKTGMSWF
jgi:hypothetical protein